MNYSKRFRVKPGERVRLRTIPPDLEGRHGDKKKIAAKLEKCTSKLREMQYLLYAEGKRSLLICLQALDAAGKDGTISHVLGAMNPQGTHVHGFKAPSREELAHDFLWRIAQKTPRKGEVAIFNRSHYEDVLVVRVHNLAPKSVWSERYALINEFERGLVVNGTEIIKFFLHIDKDEQLRRFKKRIDDPARHWKISESDYSERKYWDDYTKAYEDALSKTSTTHAPWYVIPANDKIFRNLAITRIIVETLESLDMKFPAPTVGIKDVKRRYHAAEAEEATSRGKRRARGEAASLAP